MYTQQWYLCHTRLLTAGELSDACRVSFQNKFEKLVQLVGFIIRKEKKHF